MLCCRPPYTVVVRLCVGQLVVHGGHGPGRIIAIGRRAGGVGAQEVVVVELAATLTVTLPLPLAHEQLRPLADELELSRVASTLRCTSPPSEPVWLKRHKAARTKLAAGEAIGLAEVISDGAHRQHGKTAHLSSSERELYLRARRLLADEIGYVRGIEAAQADDWISDQLEHATSP